MRQAKKRTFNGRRDEGKKRSHSKCDIREVDNRDDDRKKGVKRKGDRKEKNNREGDNQPEANRRNYSEAVLEGALRTERIYIADSIFEKNR